MLMSFLIHTYLNTLIRNLTINEVKTTQMEDQCLLKTYSRGVEHAARRSHDFWISSWCVADKKFGDH